MIHTLNYLELKQILIILGYVFEADPYAKFRTNKSWFFPDLCSFCSNLSTYLFVLQTTKIALAWEAGKATWTTEAQAGYRLQHNMASTKVCLNMHSRYCSLSDHSTQTSLISLIAVKRDTWKKRGRNISSNSNALRKWLLLQLTGIKSIRD